MAMTGLKSDMKAAFPQFAAVHANSLTFFKSKV